MHYKPALAGITLAGLASLAPCSADATPIDCAILLCMAGGFPAHPICAAAQAEMIRRITPWPIEPPVQPWLCPMGASASASETPLARIHKISVEWAEKPVLTVFDTDEPSPAYRWTVADFSAPEYDFIRTIKLWNVNYMQKENSDGTCVRTDKTVVGQYDLAADFAWTSSSSLLIPPYVIPRPLGCTFARVRGIGIEYRDYFRKLTADFYPY